MDEFSVSVIQFDDGGRHSPAEHCLRRHREEDIYAPTLVSSSSSDKWMSFPFL